MTVGKNLFFSLDVCRIFFFNLEIRASARICLHTLCDSLCVFCLSFSDFFPSASLGARLREDLLNTLSLLWLPLSISFIGTAIIQILTGYSLFPSYVASSSLLSSFYIFMSLPAQRMDSMVPGPVRHAALSVESWLLVFDFPVFSASISLH